MTAFEFRVSLLPFVSFTLCYKQYVVTFVLRCVCASIIECNTAVASLS